MRLAEQAKSGGLRSNCLNFNEVTAMAITLISRPMKVVISSIRLGPP
jgi:hypothetical protein